MVRVSLNKGKKSKPAVAKKNAPPSKAAVAKKSKAKSTVGSSGGTSADRILGAIASRVAIKDEKPERRIVMGLANITNGHSFATTIRNMKNKGWVEYDRTAIWVTKSGKDKVGSDALEIEQTNDAIQANLRENMVKGKVARELFDILCDGRAYSRSELAEMSGKENNHSFQTYCSSLSKVCEKVYGKYRLKDIAFPFGRPCDE